MTEHVALDGHGPVRIGRADQWVAWNARLESGMARYGAWLIASVVLFFFLDHARLIYTRPVWCDEIATYSVARTLSWTSYGEALQLAADAQPPTYHALQRPLLYLLGDDAQHLRWFTLLAGCVAIGAAFVWLRRHYGAVGAVAGAVALAGSKLSFYSIEARPYALMLATSALALASQGLAWRLCWLALGVSVHFYGVFVPLVFAVQERSWRGRLVYAWAYVPLVVTLPYLHPAHLLQAGDEFAPSLRNLLITVPSLAGDARYALVVLLAVGGWRWLRGMLAYHEAKSIFATNVTAWCFLAIVPVCWCLSVWITEIYFARYVLVSLLGVAALAAWLVQHLPYRAIACVAFCGLSLTGPALTKQLRSVSGWDPRPLAQQVQETIALKQGPVVMGEMRHVELHYYLPERSRGQFVRLTPRRPSFTMEYAYQQGSVEGSRWSEMIGKYAGFTPVGLDEWLDRNRTFTVLATQENDWILEACRRKGAVIQARSGDGEFLFYTVRLGAAAQYTAREPFGSIDHPVRIFEGWRELMVRRMADR